MKRIYAIVTLLVFAVSLSAQVNTKLNGFKKISAFGKMEIRLEHGKKEAITIMSKEIDVSQVKFAVNDSVLGISFMKSLTKAPKIYVVVTYVSIQEIVCDAGAKIYNRGEMVSPYLKLLVKSGGDADLHIKSDSVVVRSNKGGFAKLVGEANFVSLNTNTGGDYRALGLENDITIAKMNGGTAELNTKEYLEGNVSLGASLRYINKPKKIKKNEKLKGSIKPMEDMEND